MASLWQFNDQGLASGNVGNAPTYNDVFTKFGGQEYMTGWDPTLAMTLNAGNQGSVQSGVGAFLEGYNPLQGKGNYALNEMQDLARRFGVDPEGDNLEQRLNDKLGDYYSISGMSAGWNPTGDARQGNATLYQRKDGKLVPIQTQGGHLREEGSFIQEHPGVLAPLAVAGVGLAAGALGAGAAGGAGAGATGTGAATATGAGGAGLSGVSGSIASMLGPNAAAFWGGLPAWQQAAITGALQGGVSSGIQGQNILRGALMGGLSGGVGAAGGQWLSGATGLSPWASRAAVSAGLGGLSGGWKGALGAGLGSLATTGLGQAGLPSALAGRLGSLAGNLGAGALTGGAGGSGARSGGVGMAGGSSASPSSAAPAAGGLSGGWRQPSAAINAEQAWLQQSLAPVMAEEQKKKLAKQVAGELEEV